MGDLVPSHLGFGDMVGNKSKQRSVANISEWLEAFAVYVSVIARKQPQRVPDLMGYQILMLEASSEYHTNRWLAYDRRFRQQAASHPSCKWSSTESTLYNFAFTGQARASRCKHCFSLFHQSKDCEFAPNPPPPASHNLLSYPNTSRRRLVCYKWNEQFADGCPFPNCRYEHVCYYCAFNPAAHDCNHKAVFCPNPPAQQAGPNPTPLARQAGPQRRPRPLFP